MGIIISSRSSRQYPFEAPHHLSCGPLTVSLAFKFKIIISHFRVTVTESYVKQTTHQHALKPHQHTSTCTFNVCLFQGPSVLISDLSFLKRCQHFSIAEPNVAFGVAITASILFTNTLNSVRYYSIVCVAFPSGYLPAHFNHPTSFTIVGDLISL